MIVAVTAVAVVQVTIDDVVNVIAVRNSFVSAAFAVHVTSFVVAAGMSAGAGAGVIECALVYVVAMLAMKMSIMNVVDVIAMLNGGMSAVVAMLVSMIAVCFAISHFLLQFLW